MSPANPSATARAAVQLFSQIPNLPRPSPTLPSKSCFNPKLPQVHFLRTLPILCTSFFFLPVRKSVRAARNPARPFAATMTPQTTAFFMPLCPIPAAQDAKEVSQFLTRSRPLPRTNCVKPSPIPSPALAGMTMQTEKSATSAHGKRKLLAATSSSWNGPMKRKPASSRHFSIYRSRSGTESGIFSHFLQASAVPIRDRLPSSDTTHDLFIQGGLCRTCCVCPHSKSATQSFCLSWRNPTIFRSYTLALRALIARQPIHPQQNSYGSPNVNNEEPAATATYCFPAIAYVIGDEYIEAPHWKCHSAFPLAASSAIKFPSASPVNTSPPAVDKTPDHVGEGCFHSHLIFPVLGSRALRAP